MNEREKKLAIMVGVCLVLVGLMFTYSRLVVAPVEQMDASILQAQDQLNRLREEQQEAFEAQAAMSRLAARAFAEGPDAGAAEAGAMLTRKITEVGLSDDRFTRRPTGTRRLRGATEIGWQIQGQGPLDRIIDLLFLLENAPHLQRLESIVISPDTRNEGEVSVQFRYLTLVLDAPPDDMDEPLPAIDLADERRGLYEPILARNMLRPYIAYEPEPEPVAEDPEPAPEPDPDPPGPGPETFRVISLSEWRGKTEVLVRDTTNDRTLTYQPGDELAEGIVIMVDYRLLPMPENPGIRSQSRVIIERDSGYWAIERGTTLAETRRLEPDELPAELSEDATEAEVSQQAESP